MASWPRLGRSVFDSGVYQVFAKGIDMAPLSIDSRQIHPVTFHFNLNCGVAVVAYAVAMATCLLQGDSSAIPSLLCLAVMALFALGITLPEAGAPTLRNRRLEQQNPRDCAKPSGRPYTRMKSA